MTKKSMLPLSGAIGLLAFAGHAANITGQQRAEFDMQVGQQKTSLK